MWGQPIVVKMYDFHRWGHWLAFTVSFHQGITNRINTLDKNPYVASGLADHWGHVKVSVKELNRKGVERSEGHEDQTISIQCQLLLHHLEES